MAKEPLFTIKGRGLTIKQVFYQVENQSNYIVAYNQTKFDVRKKVSLDLKNVNLNVVLSEILNGSGYTYSINGKHIIIVEIKENNIQIVSLKPRQTIRGVVVDGASGLPVQYASVVVLNNPKIGAITDSMGNFHLDNLPVGRYDIQASFMGYEPTVFREILLTSTKEINIEIPLKENLYDLDEVVISSKVNKHQALNPAAMAGARMFSVEEANRYAGGFDDPARLVTSFSGVVGGGVSDNSISIHGNAPHLLQWKLEDLEISNPNHFADLSILGGGIFTALSCNILGNSDFFTGAFPAEYGNALSGVFDVKLKTGNNQRVENTIQGGILGSDIASEGPFKKGKPSSYIFNYRNSTITLIRRFIPDMTVGDLDYQDLSFKLNFPTVDKGVFSVWGIGVFDESENEFEKEPDEWEYDYERTNVASKQFMGAIGIGHKYFLKNGALLKTTLGMTYTVNDIDAQIMNYEKEIFPYADMKTRNYNVILTSSINKKFNARHTNKTGMTATSFFYNSDILRSDGIGAPMIQVSRGKGVTYLFSGYTNSTVNMSEQLSANLGLYAQIFALNGNWTVEPRIGLKWVLDQRHSLALSYGLHSYMERMNIYFARPHSVEGIRYPNKDLDFIKSHQIALSYNIKVSEDIQLKIEPYFQYLFDVPVNVDSSLSVLNGLHIFDHEVLENNGNGINTGIDLTLEHYLAKGFYYMFSGSVFDSRYTLGDGIWHNTRFNRHFVLNALGGKEWMVGKAKENVLNANVKVSFLGGDRYTPVDEAASENQEWVILDTSRPYELQLSPKFLVDLSVSFKINKRKVSHEFAFKMLNANAYPEYFGHSYNLKTKEIMPDRQATIIPNFSYKIEF